MIRLNIETKNPDVARAVTVFTAVMAIAKIVAGFFLLDYGLDSVEDRNLAGALFSLGLIALIFFPLARE